MNPARYGDFTIPRNPTRAGLALDACGYHRMLRVARTIAEALSYRRIHHAG